MGCYYHACDCQFEKIINSTDEEQMERALKRREIDEEKREFFEENLGMNYVVVWECVWKRELKENNKELKTFMKRHYPYRKREVTVREMTKKIIDGSIFGYVECDIEVPEELKKTGKFENFPPIFKNVEVSKDDIGETMQNYADDNGYLKRPL